MPGNATNMEEEARVEAARVEAARAEAARAEAARATKEADRLATKEAIQAKAKEAEIRPSSDVIERNRLLADRQEAALLREIQGRVRDRDVGYVNLWNIYRRQFQDRGAFDRLLTRAGLRITAERVVTPRHERPALPFPTLAEVRARIPHDGIPHRAFMDLWQGRISCHRRNEFVRILQEAGDMHPVTRRYFRRPATATADQGGVRSLPNRPAAEIIANNPPGTTFAQLIATGQLTIEMAMVVAEELRVGERVRDPIGPDSAESSRKVDLAVTAVNSR